MLNPRTKTFSPTADDDLLRVSKAQALLTLIAVVQLLLYVGHSANPMYHAVGWNGWWDQSQYWRSATALAHFNLSPDQHWYPLGYALLAAPFVELAPAEPFIYVNVVCTWLYGWAFIRLFRPHIGLWLAFGALAVSLLLPMSTGAPYPMRLPILTQFTVPWNSVPVAAAYLWIMVLISDVWHGRATARTDLAIGALAAVVLVTRPMDVVPLAIPGIAYVVLRLYRDRSFRRFGLAALGGTAVLAAVGAVHFSIHGSLSTPYSTVAGQIGFSVTHIPERLYAIVVDSATIWGEPYSILRMQPWLFAALPLAAVWLVVQPREALLPVALPAASVLAYMVYNDFSPLSLVRFMLIHYLAWVLPVLLAAGACGLAALVRERRWRVAVAAGLAAPLLFAAIGVERKVLATDSITVTADASGRPAYDIRFPRRRDIDAIDFIGATTSDWTQLTLQQFQFQVDGEPMALFRDYRAFTLEGGVRVLFNRGVAAEHILIALDPVVVAPPQDPGLVAPVRFAPSLKAPWASPPIPVLAPGESAE